MLFPPSFEEKLGFNTIRDILKKGCRSNIGKQLVDDIHFSDDHQYLRESLAVTEEMRNLILFSNSFPSLQLADIDKELELLSIEGSFVEVEVVTEIRDSVQNALDFLSFIRKQETEKYPRIAEKVSVLSLDKSIIKKIDSWVDEKGRIRDNATPALNNIRAVLAVKRNEVDRKMDKIFRQVKKEGWTEEGLEPTIRNGRMVIPMVAAHKRKLRGFIHDESSTGHTVFLEPEEIFNTNNEIRELEFEERHEIIKVLIMIADYLRPLLPEIKECFKFLGWLDFLQSKAHFALSTGSFLPEISKNPGLEWFQARHPLLFLSHQALKKKVVPLDIALDTNNRILIISGPNAGGKSVCLKTAGLLQYMLQCGLLIPANEGSSSGIFRNIFIDIGDEQSLENDLSTYSSHLLHMQHFLNHADHQTLFLIDEFGTGTEPQVGGAIAETILEELNKRKAFGVITTHYTNLKLMAGKNNGIVNGAMTFDRIKMEPLFKLETGKPGSSFAFEIARKIGLDEDLLTKATDKAGRGQFDFDEQLRELEVERKQIADKNSQFRMADDFLAETIEKYQRLSAELQQSRKKILEQAKTDALRILAESNKLVEKTIKEIRENQADKEKTRAIRQEFEELKQKIEQQIEASVPILSEPVKSVKKIEKVSHPLPPLKPKPFFEIPEEKTQKPDLPKVTTGPIKPGDWVKMTGQHTPGIVETLRGKEAVVSFGSVTLKCNISRLEKATLEEIKKVMTTPSGSKYGNIINDLNQKLSKFQSTIDLRGKRAEEALSELQHYIDEAILLEIFEVRILHGKGDGILRELVRKFLSTVNEVKSFRDEVLELGGHGITVVNFR
ncbi:MAG: endonuclease MutS2 [Bacteroidales bacterium]